MTSRRKPASREPWDVIGDDGLVRVLEARCETCIFWPGNRMHLAPGRFDDVVQRNLAAGALLTCHETLPGNEHGCAPAVCAGFWARHRKDVTAGRIAHLIGIRRIRLPEGNQP